MSDNDGLPENIEKFKFLDLFMMLLAGKEGVNRKIVLKELMQKERHLTIMLVGNILDIHETIEGPEKTYKPIAKIDLSPLKDMKSLDISAEEMYRNSGIQEIDINAPEYANLAAFAPNERFENIEVKKNEAKVTYDSTLPVCLVPQIAERDYRYVLVSDGKSFQFVIIKTHGKYYKLTLEAMGKLLFLAMPEPMKHFFAQLGMTEAELQKELQG